jgi:hypothetical protein
LARNPFVKGKGWRVQSASKKYWDDSLDGGDSVKVKAYMDSKKWGPPTCGLFKFGFTKRSRPKTKNVPCSSSQVIGISTETTETTPASPDLPCSSSQVIDISTETSHDAAGDEATNAENVTAYISLFVDSVGWNGG